MSGYGCVVSHDGLACVDNTCYAPPTTKDLNEACDHLNVCKPGLTCFNGKCKRPEGAACSAKSDCGSYLSCAGGKCKASRTGEKCESSRECVGGLYCASKDGVCKVPSFRGETCDEEAACFNTKCYEGKCQLHAFQTTCQKEGSDCDDNLVCAGGKCQYRLQEGEPCESSVECEIGLCTDGACKGPSGSAGSCKNDADCPNGKLCTSSGSCCKANEGIC